MLHSCLLRSLNCCMLAFFFVLSGNVLANDAAARRDALLAYYSDWAGTRYKLGGTSQNGVDCSSFIQALFQDKFQTSLPRSSREQMVLGQRVDPSDLRSGDLVFFRTGPTRRHVGVYVGANKFMHVSSSSGVEIARLHTPYWQRHFITARRVEFN